jgi:hypothetical protein
MRPPTEILDLFAEWAESATHIASDAAAKDNVPLALQNWSEAATDHFSRGLIGWRTQLTDPMADLVATVDVSGAAIAFVRSHDAEPFRDAFDPVPGAFAALLLDLVGAPTIDELERATTAVPGPGVPVYRRLAAWLARAIRGEPTGPGRALARACGSVKRYTLLADSYATYFDLVDADVAGPAAVTLTRRALELFAAREHDGFFAGGIQYESGGEYNDLVVDFRLAAIWRARGFDVGRLEPGERVHVHAFREGRQPGHPTSSGPNVRPSS